MSWRTPGPDRDCPPHAWRKSFLPTVALAAMPLFALPPAQAQTTQQSNAVSSFNVIGANVQQRANGVLAIMAYSVVPDLTSSSLSISNAQSGNPGVQLSQLTGGFTVSSSFPLYLEGAIAYSHYDPKFLATNGDQSLSVPTSWNTVSGTGGIGWDFPLTADGELVLRPIFNVSLGSVTSNVNSARTDIGRIAGQVIDFLEHGSLNAWGIGGSLMLDWERRRDTYEADVNLRYTNIRLRSFGGSSEAVEGSASAQVATLYARWRAPTSLMALDRPVRYLLFIAHSRLVPWFPSVIEKKGLVGFFLNSLDDYGRRYVITQALGLLGVATTLLWSFGWAIHYIALINNYAAGGNRFWSWLVGTTRVFGGVGGVIVPIVLLLLGTLLLDGTILELWLRAGNVSVLRS